ncbi:MAG: GNAT family N-acetyltransferase [Rhodospirillaceae bacterium]
MNDMANTMADAGTATVTLRAPKDAADWQQVHGLRRRALFAHDPDYDPDHPDDRNPDHRVLVLAAGEDVLGTLRLDFSQPVWAAMRLVAVDPERRGLGFGRAMLAKAEAFIKEKGWRQVRLHAKPLAVGFYQRAGYHPVHWDEPPRDPNGVNMGKAL